MRIVVDTNVILSAFFFGGVPGRILEAWHDGSVRIAISPSILAEYQAAGSTLEAKYGGTEFGTFLALLAMNCDVVDASSKLEEQICTDPDDDKFLTCALAGGIPLVVSGDEHLLSVSGWNGIEVLKPRAFVDKHLTSRGGKAR